MSRLRTALARFDGKHTAALVKAEELARDDLAGLVALCSDADVAVAATWVVKALAEKGVAVDLARAFAGMRVDGPWDAQLHLLQCAQFAPEIVLTRIDVVRALMDARKTLVRVWALDAFVRGADIEPAWRAEAARAVDVALDGGAASLRARARALKVICADW